MILFFSPSPDNKRIYAFERFLPGTVNRATSVIPWLSGKGINAARAAASMGERVLFTGFMGEDMRAAALPILHRVHIEPRLVFTRAHTRSCITILDESRGIATELIEEAPPVSALDASALIALFKELLAVEDIDVAVLSGSLPAGCPADIYKRCVIACREHDIPVIVDAAAEPLHRALVDKPDVIKINMQEFKDAFTIRRGEVLHDAVSRISGDTAGLVIITDGPHNIMFSRAGEQCAFVRPPEVHAVNPIGSGDAFAAGLALGISRRYDDERSIALAAAMGAANAMTLRPGELAKNEVEQMVEEMKMAAQHKR